MSNQLQSGTLLEIVKNDIVFPGTDEVRDADELFKRGPVNASMIISSTGEDWEDNFSGMKVGPQPSSTVSTRLLLETSRDTTILSQLGGEEAAELSLAEFSFLLGNIGKETFLAYIRNKEGIMVCALAHLDFWKWNLHCEYLGDPDPRINGYLIATRNSRVNP